MRGLCLVLLSLCGCAAAPHHEPARYDIALAVPAAAKLPGLALSAIEVRAPTWLASAAMQYRLAYAQGARRDTYADSRWVAPPAELLERALTRRVMASAGQAPAGGCRLVLELDEFLQAFESPGASHALLELRASLYAPHGAALLARRTFSQKPPAGADAKTGVAAFGIAAALLADDLGAWLDALASGPQGFARRCRDG